MFIIIVCRVQMIATNQCLQIKSHQRIPVFRILSGATGGHVYTYLFVLTCVMWLHLAPPNILGQAVIQLHLT